MSVEGPPSATAFGASLRHIAQRMQDGSVSGSDRWTDGSLGSRLGSWSDSVGPRVGWFLGGSSELGSELPSDVFRWLEGEELHGTSKVRQVWWTIDVPSALLENAQPGAKLRA